MIRLLNRRFVPFCFDLSDRGALGDPDAREFVVATRADLGSAQVSTPPVLVATPGGEVLAEISNYADADTMLRELLGVLDRHPEWNAPGAEEAKLEDSAQAGDAAAALALAEIRIDLADYGGARALLRDVIAAGRGELSDRARLAAAHAARLAGDREGMLRELEGIADKDAHREAAALERAQAAFAARDLDAMEEALRALDQVETTRETEILYLRGLLAFHRGDREEARKAWTRCVKQHAQDRFVYRADWALSEMGRDKTQKHAVFVSSRGDPNSLLGRIGYMGSPHPDLR